jgi:hypothetical protein
MNRIRDRLVILGGVVVMLVGSFWYLVVVSTREVQSKLDQEAVSKTPLGQPDARAAVAQAETKPAAAKPAKPHEAKPGDANESGQEKRISGDHWFGCVDREYLGNLVKYAVQKDNEAFTRALTAGLLTGACTPFKNGEVVYITDVAFFSGNIKVRRKGETKEYWTVIEALSKTTLGQPDARPPVAQAETKPAAAKPEKKTQEDKKIEDSKPEDKKPAKLGIWDGFRGVKWGTKIEDLTGFRKIHPDEISDFGSYVRENEPMNIGGAQLESVVYTFLDGELCGVFLTTKGKGNSDALKEALTARFGKPQQDNPFLDNYKWFHNLLAKDGVGIKLNYEMFSNDGECYFVHGAGLVKLREREQKKAQEGAKKDF